VHSRLFPQTELSVGGYYSHDHRCFRAFDALRRDELAEQLARRLERRRLLRGADEDQAGTLTGDGNRPSGAIDVVHALAGDEVAKGSRSTGDTGDDAAGAAGLLLDRGSCRGGGRELGGKG